VTSEQDPERTIIAPHKWTAQASQACGGSDLSAAWGLQNKRPAGRPGGSDRPGFGYPVGPGALARV